MSDGSEFWITLCAMLAVVLILLIGGITMVNLYDTRRTADLIAKAPDPVAMQCALGSYARNSAFCGAYMARKGD